MLDRGRIMRANLAADAILERRDDLSARRVILGIRREHQEHIERQPDRIPFDLHVAFLHDVEQAHLDLARQIRQFVDARRSRGWRAAADRNARSAHRNILAARAPL